MCVLCVCDTKCSSDIRVTVVCHLTYARGYDCKVHRKEKSGVHFAERVDLFGCELFSNNSLQAGVHFTYRVAGTEMGVDEVTATNQ